MATVTANRKYRYNDEVFGRTLDTWAQEVHKYNAKMNGWKYFPLKPGAYGYDNNIVALMRVFKALEDDPDILADHDAMCQLIHEGWIENYVYWRDNKPYDKDDKYRKPAKPLNDARRNALINKRHDELPQDEQEKTVVYVDFIKECLEAV